MPIPLQLTFLLFLRYLFCFTTNNNISNICSPSGYEVQYRRLTNGRPNRDNWVKSSKSVVKDTDYIVGNLPEGGEYEFRVCAINDAGLGKPSKTTGSHVVRDPICEYFILYIHRIICFFKYFKVILKKIKHAVK